LLAIYTVVGAHASVPTIAGVPSVPDVFIVAGHAVLTHGDKAL